MDQVNKNKDCPESQKGIFWLSAGVWRQYTFFFFSPPTCVLDVQGDCASGSQFIAVCSPGHRLLFFFSSDILNPLLSL